jgi:ABC-type glycerol-3-phosphate transport system permease component
MADGADTTAAAIRPRAARRRRSERRRMTRTGAVARHVTLAAFTALSALPVYFMVINAFKSNAEYVTNKFAPPREWTLSTMESALSSGDLYLWLGNSALITGLAVVGSTVIAALGAYPIALMRWRPAGFVLGALVAMMVVPPIVLVVPLFQQAAAFGALNTYWVAIVIYAGVMVPFSTFMLATFFQTLPRELLEAARIDGAGSLRTLVSIVLPLSRPALVTVVIVQALWAWNEVLIALVFLQQDHLRTLMVGLTVFQGRYQLDVPLVMAGMLWATIPMLALYLAGQRFFIRGLTAGGVKG